MIEKKINLSLFELLLERTVKKIDLHMHTIPTISDAHFIFSIDKLNEYVNSAELDAIAVTNHDIFDLNQFSEIAKKLDCVVFPGIEINLDKCHILVISENENLDDFQLKTRAVSEKIKVVGDSITVEELIHIFGDLNQYLIIPHYEKKPSISGATLEQIREFISAGEVDSPKKFSLRDRSKVSLSRSEGNSLFQVFDDGQKLSTGLNILFGARSSGKTVT